jgi:hypothetical protein
MRLGSTRNAPETVTVHPLMRNESVLSREITDWIISRCLIWLSSKASVCPAWAHRIRVSARRVWRDE